jgi:hypothetical protein
MPSILAGRTNGRSRRSGSWSATGIEIHSLDVSFSLNLGSPAVFKILKSPVIKSYVSSSRGSLVVKNRFL